MCLPLTLKVPGRLFYVRLRKVLFLCRKCCLLQCCCVIFMQIVLILCRLCCFYANCEVFNANSAVLMQIVLIWCKWSHLSQFTLFCRKWHFCRKIRALAGTFGSAIRRRLLLMMSGLKYWKLRHWLAMFPETRKLWTGISWKSIITAAPWLPHEFNWCCNIKTVEGSWVTFSY